MLIQRNNPSIFSVREVLQRKPELEKFMENYSRRRPRGQEERNAGSARLK